MGVLRQFVSEIRKRQLTFLGHIIRESVCVQKELMNLVEQIKKNTFIKDIKLSNTSSFEELVKKVKSRI